MWTGQPLQSWVVNCWINSNFVCLIIKNYFILGVFKKKKRNSTGEFKPSSFIQLWKGWWKKKNFEEMFLGPHSSSGCHVPEHEGLFLDRKDQRFKSLWFFFSCFFRIVKQEAIWVRHILFQGLLFYILAYQLGGHQLFFFNCFTNSFNFLAVNEN